MKNSVKLFYWLPRIICILAILFVSLFALDAFEEGLSIKEQLMAFIIHLVPSLILIILLIIAWKWEKIGGIIFIILGLGFSPYIFINNYKMNHSIWLSSSIILAITFPFIIAGVLFIVNHIKNQERKVI